MNSAVQHCGSTEEQTNQRGSCRARQCSIFTAISRFLILHQHGSSTTAHHSLGQAFDQGKPWASTGCAPCSSSPKVANRPQAHRDNPKGLSQGLSQVISKNHPHMEQRSPSSLWALPSALPLVPAAGWCLGRAGTASGAHQGGAEGDTARVPSLSCLLLCHPSTQGVEYFFCLTQPSFQQICRQEKPHLCYELQVPGFCLGRHSLGDC